MPATPAMDSGGGRMPAANISILGKVQEVLNQKLVGMSNQLQQQSYVTAPQRQALQQATNRLQNPPQKTPAQLAQEESFILPRRSINDYQDPYARSQNSANDPFRAFQLSPLANDNEDVLTGFDLFTKDRSKTNQLFENMTPEQQDKAAQKSRENREYVDRKNRIVSEVENIQAKDANLPSVEREALTALKFQLSQLRVKDANNDLNPIVVALKNLGTRSQYRIEFSEWKRNKSAGTSMSLPTALPTTSEEFDQVGGLGGFLTQGSTSKNANDFDRTPAVFGKLITRDANGVETIMKAEDWVAARIADTKPLPTDSPEERRRKEKLAADWISTLAFSDKYNSFAQKRDAGYRVQLDSDGNPVRAYFLKPDEDALKNLTAEILSDMGTHNIVGPVEDWIQAYAEQRQNLAQDATGIYGNGQSSSSGSGYGYGGGGFGGYGGGGGGGVSTYYPSDAELLEPANGVARARLGRVMNAEEEQQFVAFFRSVEASVSANGGSLARLDPQAQMIAFLESRMNKEAAGQQAGKFVAALMNMLRSGNFNVS